MNGYKGSPAAGYHAMTVQPTPRSPSLIISLAPDGTPHIELPWSLNREFRVIPLDKPSTTHSTILSILAARQRAEIGIGSDGAPTQAQVRHWELHRTIVEPRCAFCRAAAKANGLRLVDPAALAKVRQVKTGLRREESRGNGKVKVRTIPAKAKKHQPGTPITIKSITLGDLL
jgi:hypothetical protein